MASITFDAKIGGTGRTALWAVNKHSVRDDMATSRPKANRRSDQPATGSK